MRCHFPDCPTMKDPIHPWASVRGSKLNGRTQISCGACSKKARQLEEFKFKEINYFLLLKFVSLFISYLFSVLVIKNNFELNKIILSINDLLPSNKS